MNLGTYNNRYDAIAAAHRQSRVLECGYAYVIQWKPDHYTVSLDKPLVRNRDTKILCCSQGREELA